MSKGELISKIKDVEKIASASKLRRFLNQPYKYLFAILHRELFFKRTKKEKEAISSTFFDVQMHLLLPSSTDIYLTGGKSHDSEIRLAKFLASELLAGDVFFDIGAHYGYFSLIASKLIGKSGKVVSFEASPKTYSVLAKNGANFQNISTNNLAVSDTNEDLIFYEFPNLYSEYNSLDVSQFENEKWYANNKPQSVHIKSITMDNFIDEKGINPKVVKIDVEGAEFKVINGFKKYLAEHSPIIIIEYLCDDRGNEEHIRAENLLIEKGLSAHIIKADGSLEMVTSVSKYMQKKGIDSDNIVFKKI